MNYLRRVSLVLAWFTAGIAAPVVAAPPPAYSPGPNPFFGSPGAYSPNRYTYPAPGVYGSTVFAPFGPPALSTGGPVYNVPLPPAEFPAVAVAHVTVRVPADAKLWANGVLMKLPGPTRAFVTPLLQAGFTYPYTFRAEWNADGRTVTRERRAVVGATGSTIVDFTTP